MSKPTSAPWKVSYSGGPDLKSIRVHVTGVTADGVKDICFPLRVEAEDDARLIAAAPELLEALQAASHALKSYQYGNASTELAQTVAEAADAAIAKATKP